MRHRLFAERDNKIADNDCTILIFGESHKEAHTIKIIHAISELLRRTNDDPITYAYEFFKIYDKASAEEKLRESSEIKSTRVSKCKDNIEQCERLLEMFEVGSQEHADAERIIQNEQIQMTSDLQESYQERLEADYLSELDELDIGYLGIDQVADQRDKEQWKDVIRAEQMIEERDNHMANQIARLLANNKIIIAHVGSLHVEGIVNNLLKMGVKPEKISAHIVQSTNLRNEDYKAIADHFDDAFNSFFGKNDMDLNKVLGKIERLAPYLKSDKSTVAIKQLVVNNDINNEDYMKIAAEVIEECKQSSLPKP